MTWFACDATLVTVCFQDPLAAPMGHPPLAVTPAVAPCAVVGVASGKEVEAGVARRFSMTGSHFDVEVDLGIPGEIGVAIG